MEQDKTTGPNPVKKNWIRRHPWFSAFIVLVFLLIIKNLNNSNGTQTNNIQQPVANTSTTAPTTQNNNPSFQKITIKDLVTSDFNDQAKNNSGFTIPFVEYQGTVTKEYSEQGSYYFKIEDGNGYSAIASIDPKKTPGLNKKLNIGDVVIIRGINSSLGDCKSPGSSIADFCKGVTESNLPITLLMAPDPQLGNKQAIEIISSSSKSTTTTQTSQPTQTTIPQYQETQLANINPKNKSELVDFKGTMDISPIKITDDNSNTIYLMTVKDGNVTATLQLNKYTAVFTGVKGDEVEVRGTITTPISFCHGTDQSLAYWCSLMDLQDGGLLVIPNYINNLNPQNHSTVQSNHY